jgi:hypothetical protein
LVWPSKTTNDIVPPIRHEGPDSLLSDHQKAQAAAEAADDDDENEEADQTGVTAATEATEGDGSGDEESDVGEVSEDELAALKAEAGEEEPEEEEKPAGRRSSRRTKEKLDYAGTSQLMSARLIREGAMLICLYNSVCRFHSALAKAQGLDGDDSD